MKFNISLSKQLIGAAGRHNSSRSDFCAFLWDLQRTEGVRGLLGALWSPGCQLRLRKDSYKRPRFLVSSSDLWWAPSTVPDLRVFWTFFPTADSWLGASNTLSTSARKRPAQLMALVYVSLMQKKAQKGNRKSAVFLLCSQQWWCRRGHGPRYLLK